MKKGFAVVAVLLADISEVAIGGGTDWPVPIEIGICGDFARLSTGFIFAACVLGALVVRWLLKKR